MKIYNRKGFLAGIFWSVLGLWSIIFDFHSPSSNTLVQTKHIIVSIILLLIGISSVLRAFSKQATKEDMDKMYDERNRLIKYKSQSKMLDIVYGILFVFIVCGMVGFKITGNMIWFSILIIPGFLFGLFLIIEIFVKLYYEKHE